jgi:hypothetical protein
VTVMAPSLVQPMPNLFELLGAGLHRRDLRPYVFLLGAIGKGAGLTEAAKLAGESATRRFLQILCQEFGLLFTRKSLRNSYPLRFSWSVTGAGVWDRAAVYSSGLLVLGVAFGESAPSAERETSSDWRANAD